MVTFFKWSMLKRLSKKDQLRWGCGERMLSCSEWRRNQWPSCRKTEPSAKCLIDDHVVMAFAGLTADARILISRARLECQSHRLTVEDPVTLEYITRHVATLKQQYTQSNGRRPFGISCLIGGFDYDGTPHLYQTDPSGTYHEWKANVVGRSAKSVREYLEKHYSAEAVESEKGAVRLAICALLEVVQSGGKNLEVVLMRRGEPMKIMDVQEIEEYVSAIEKEKEEEAEKKKQPK